MKTFDNNNRAAAIEQIIQSMTATGSENWTSGNNVSVCFGWDRSALSPVTRAAFVEQYGESLTGELENAAKAKMAEREAIGQHYREHAAEADANATKTAAELVVGDYVWCLDRGLKFDHQQLTRHLEEFIEGENEDASGHSEYKHVRRRLCKIERIVNVADMTDALATWKPLDGDGGSASDDVPDDWDVYGTDETKADRKAKIATFYTLGVLARTPSGEWVIVDSEGFEYPRYVLLPTDYRTIYAPQVNEIITRRELERIAAEEAQREKEAAERAAYEARCAKWAPVMVEKLVKGDWKNNKTRTKRNVLAMAKHAAPGVRFSLKMQNGWGEGWLLSWTNGPTVDELKNAADFGLFCVGVDTFDGMTDCAVYDEAKYTDFAEMYGCISNGVEFNHTKAETDRNRKPVERTFAAEIVAAVA